MLIEAQRQVCVYVTIAELPEAAERNERVTNCKAHAPASEAVSCSAVQPVDSLLRSQQSATGLYLPNQLNPIHTLPSDLLAINVNVILPSTPMSSTSSLFVRFSCRNFVYHACYMPSTFHFPQFCHSNYISRIVQIVKLLVVRFLPFLLSPHPC
jgi:hypothetical protein